MDGVAASHPGPHAVSEEASRIALEQAEVARPGTPAEYFAVLLARAAATAGRGNYGVAACLSVRRADVELICLGVSSMFTDRDPIGHAETNALRAFRSWQSSGADSPPVDRWDGAARVARGQGGCFVRPSPEPGEGSTLFATLEPCPMCTVAIVNSGIERVVIGLRDDAAGAMASERLKGLAPIWPRLVRRRGLRIDFAADLQPSEAIPSSVIDELDRVFETSRNRLDEWIAAGGLMHDVDLGRFPGVGVLGARADVDPGGSGHRA